ncbi:hypothetical protein HJB86_07970 [Rhizobium sp. NZLR3b]|uniref:hypothetical protein n=1 Tax=Rhizobium sp. NZLR3b TaxID=2731101 RepID=UPI001C83FAA9|nr:hypothetical protein [Rhizobium sp. NZLR3b]MBX5188841.1 hypothetical protein [Rhizobium sp. NZLR3b]
MTKRLNLICLVAFFLCFAGAFTVSRLNGGTENTHGTLKYVSNAIGAAMLGLFPFSVGSYILTRGWREVRKNKEHREFILKNPIFTFLIWREEIDGE